MKFYILLLFAASCAAEMTMDVGDGKYNFMYSTGDAGGHKREESGGADGVSGKYSYIDPNGNLREVSYKAGAGIGFQASGDISVDKKTAEEAEKIAALAPKPIEVDLKAAHLGVPFYGAWHAGIPVGHWPAAGHLPWNAAWAGHHMYW